jgi:DNA-directed RNA polymerase specialized sigma24 family protein
MQPPDSRRGPTLGENILGASNDQVDVEKVLAGDIDAFELVVRRWHRPLINLAYRFCRDAGRAEEMAQEALLRAYRALHQWRKDGAFSTWLFALSTNLYRSELARIPARTISIEEAGELQDTQASDGRLENSCSRFPQNTAMSWCSSIFIKWTFQTLLRAFNYQKGR